MRSEHSASTLELHRAEAATWGPPSQTMKLVQFEPISGSSTMLARFDIELASGIVLLDFRLISGNDGPWVAMPSSKAVDRDNHIVPNPVTGKPIYQQHIGFRDRGVKAQFVAQIMEQIRRDRPDFVDAGGR